MELIRYAIIGQPGIAIPPIVAYPSACIGYALRSVYTLYLEIGLCKSRDWFLPEAK
jgi:hypothetical protein